MSRLTCGGGYVLSNCSRSVITGQMEQRLRIRQNGGYEGDGKMLRRVIEGQGIGDHVYDGRVNDGRVNDGRVNDGRVNDGRVNDGRVNDGRVKDGRVNDGRITMSGLIKSAKIESDTFRTYDGVYIECHMILGEHLMEEAAQRSQTGVHLGTNVLLKGGCVGTGVRYDIIGKELSRYESQLNPFV